jgi:predicted Rossmann fold nucleotide-binding protein DprA/Smf involved in DNA uptake
MPGTSKAVDAAADLIRERLRELDQERAQLDAALTSLGASGSPRRGPGRPRGSAAAPANGRRRRRRRGGTRADQAVKLISANPGISASDIAKQMKIKPNYLYRVLSELENEGKVKKDGRAYSAA